MGHVVFYLPNGQVVGHTQCQDGLEHLAFNPRTNLKIEVEAVPEAPIASWQVINGKLIADPNRYGPPHYPTT